MSSLFKGKKVAGKKHKEDSYNKNWKTEIAAYDSECQGIERDFHKKHMIISGSGMSDLTDEENDVLTLFLNGVSCDEIAKQYKVEIEVITGLLEIIKAKLSLIDK